MRAKRLLMTADDADVSGTIAILPQRVHRGDTLPGGGSHQTFSQDDLGGKPCGGPIPPGSGFRGIKPRHALKTVSE